MGSRSLQPGEVVLVRVPAAQRERDEPHAGLDQPAGQQAAHAERILAERLGERGRFLADVEGFAGAVRGDDRVGLLAETVQAVQQLVVRLEPWKVRVQGAQQLLAAFHLGDGQRRPPGRCRGR